MQIARVSLDGEDRICVVRDGTLVPVPMSDAEWIDRSWLQWSRDEFDRRAHGPAVEPEGVRYLPAVPRPDKIIAVGLNYHAHAAESRHDVPTEPLLFSKANNTLAAHGDVISCPNDLTTRPDYEAELAVVVGRTASTVPVDDALDYVFAYTIANDVSARDVQFADGQWFRGKSLDGFCPVGPWLTLAESVADVMDLRISCKVNGKVMQDDSTASMIFDVPYIISYIARHMTLRPGDVILTGTPAGVGFSKNPPRFLRMGDRVDVEIEGLGVLSNVVSTDPRTGEPDRKSPAAVGG